jgi:hypothetical protein
VKPSPSHGREETEKSKAAWRKNITTVVCAWSRRVVSLVSKTLPQRIRMRLMEGVCGGWAPTSVEEIEARVYRDEIF